MIFKHLKWTIDEFMLIIIAFIKMSINHFRNFWKLILVRLFDTCRCIGSVVTRFDDFLFPSITVHGDIRKAKCKAKPKKGPILFVDSDANEINWVLLLIFVLIFVMNIPNNMYLYLNWLLWITSSKFRVPSYCIFIYFPIK